MEQPKGGRSINRGRFKVLFYNYFETLIMGRLLCTGGTLTVQIRTVDSQSGLRILLLL